MCRRKIWGYLKLTTRIDLSLTSLFSIGTLTCLIIVPLRLFNFEEKSCPYGLIRDPYDYKFSAPQIQRNFLSKIANQWKISQRFFTDLTNLQMSLSSDKMKNVYNYARNDGSKKGAFWPMSTPTIIRVHWWPLRLCFWEKSSPPTLIKDPTIIRQARVS